MKKTILNFGVCNLITFGFGSICELTVLVAFSLFAPPDLVYYFLRSACIALCLPFALYFIFFKKNKRFKEYYLSCKDDTEANISVAKSYFGKNVKYLAIVLAVSVLIITVIPKNWTASSADLANSLSFHNDVINILLSSSSLFAEYLPELIFGKDTLVLRLVGALLWSAYFVFSYWLTMKLAVKKWDKSGVINPRKINARRLLALAGIAFQIDFWYYLLFFSIKLAQGSESDNSGGYQMLFSILLIVTFEVFYLIEAILAVVKDSKGFNIFKLCTVTTSVFFLMVLMYNGVVESIVCNVFLVFLLIVESVSLLKDKKREKDVIC